MDLVDKIMAYEDGEMDDDQVLEFFGELVRSGHIRHLQGHYGRVANHLIDQGYLSQTGEVML